MGASPYLQGSAGPRPSSLGQKGGSFSSRQGASSNASVWHHAWHTWPGLRAGPPLTERPSRDPLGPQKYRRCPRAGAMDVLNLASDGLCDPRVALQPFTSEASVHASAKWDLTRPGGPRKDTNPRRLMAAGPPGLVWHWG